MKSHLLAIMNRLNRLVEGGDPKETYNFEREGEVMLTVSGSPMFIVCVPIFRIVGEAVIMLTVDDLQELTVRNPGDFCDFGRLPVNIHMKRVMLDVRHVFIELVFYPRLVLVFPEVQQERSDERRVQ